MSVSAAPGNTRENLTRSYGVPPQVTRTANKPAPRAQPQLAHSLIGPGSASASPRLPAKVDIVTPDTGPPTPLREALLPSPPAEPQQTPAQPSDALEGPPREPARLDPSSFRWPVQGRVIARFGDATGDEKNEGINLAVPEGTPVKAAQGGVVVYADNKLKRYGNLVLVRHEGDWVTAYAHLSEMLVRPGDKVTRGQIIAKTGQSGSVSSPQLHFEIRQGPIPVDPLQHLALFGSTD